MCEVVAITFSCVMFIHLGLVDAILSVYSIEDKVPIITCPKCLTFWSVLCFLVLTGHNIIHSVAIAFLTAYSAIWFDLLLGLMDAWYEDIYNRISERSNTSEIHHEDNRKSKGEDYTLPEV